tara:strand:+ start:41483 stop:41767 length:285 start_codon:yes stop_codon:yes gene_type:complete
MMIEFLKMKMIHFPICETTVSSYTTSQYVRFPMKRAKRNNKAEHAYKLGYNQGIKGHDKGNCPFESLVDERQEWLGGWRKGHSDYVHGYRDSEL